MVKLTDRKIRWIIREKTKGILSTNDIALLQNVTDLELVRYGVITRMQRQYRYLESLEDHLELLPIKKYQLLLERTKNILAVR